MLGQLLIAEMRDSQALASCQHAFLQAMGELSRPQVPRALQAGALNGRMPQSVSACLARRYSKPARVIRFPRALRNSSGACTEPRTAIQVRTESDTSFHSERM